MKNLLNSKSEIKDQARRFELKGRSKIETVEQLLKSMKVQGFESERKVLMSVNRRIKNLHERTQSTINNLGYPESPLKGYGHARSEYFSKDIFDSFNVPSSHIDEISSRRQKGYFSWNTVISIELDNILSEFERKYNTIAKEFFTIKTPAEIKSEELTKELEAQKEAERKEKEKYFESLGGYDAIFVEFFKNETHPAPQAVYDAKVASGMSWNSLRFKYAN